MNTSKLHMLFLQLLLYKFNMPCNLTFIRISPFDNFLGQTMCRKNQVKLFALRLSYSFSYPLANQLIVTMISIEIFYAMQLRITSGSSICRFKILQRGFCRRCGVLWIKRYQIYIFNIHLFKTQSDFFCKRRCIAHRKIYIYILIY